MRTVKNIFIFTGVFLLTALLLDRYVKLAEISTGSILNYTNEAGYVFKPGAGYFNVNEGFGMGRINSSGFIGAEPSLNKGKVKIALIGDSFVQGFQVFDRNHFRRMLEKTLKEKYNIDAEVMNFGRADFDINDMYTYSQTFISKFKPDITLYFLCNDDFAPSNRQPGKPYVYEKNDSLKTFLYPGFEESLPWYLRIGKYSDAFPVLGIFENCIAEAMAGRTYFILFDKFIALFPKKKNPEVKIAPPDSLQSRILKELSSRPGNLIVDRERNGLRDDIRSAVISSGLGIISLNDTLSALKQSGINPYYWKNTKEEGHWNNEAHKAIGIFLAEKINEYLKQKKLK